MPSSYYPPEDEAPMTESPMDQGPTDKGEEDMGKETFLVSNSALGADPEVGDTYTMKVVAVHDGESECEVAPEKEESPEPDMPERPTTGSMPERFRSRGARLE